MKAVNSTDGKKMWSDIALERVQHNIEQYVKKMEQDDENDSNEETEELTTDSEFSKKSGEGEESEEEYNVFVKNSEKRLKKPEKQEATYFTNIIQMQERYQTKAKLLKQSFNVSNTFQEMVAERVSNFRVAPQRSLTLKRLGAIEMAEDDDKNLDPMPPLIQGDILT